MTDQPLIRPSAPAPMPVPAEIPDTETPVAPAAPADAPAQPEQEEQEEQAEQTEQTEEPQAEATPDNPLEDCDHLLPEGEKVTLTFGSAPWSVRATRAGTKLAYRPEGRQRGVEILRASGTREAVLAMSTMAMVWNYSKPWRPTTYAEMATRITDSIDDPVLTSRLGKTEFLFDQKI